MPPAPLPTERWRWDDYTDIPGVAPFHLLLAPNDGVYGWVRRSPRYLRTTTETIGWTAFVATGTVGGAARVFTRVLNDEGNFLGLYPGIAPHSAMTAVVLHAIADLRST